MKIAYNGMPSIHGIMLHKSVYKLIQFNVEKKNQQKKDNRTNQKIRKSKLFIRSNQISYLILEIDVNQTKS